MSGHSKWSTIKRKKGKTDAQRAKIFTKIGREISICVKEGGPDPAVNSRLRDCISRGKSLNVPNDNIERIIKKASGEANNTQYEEIVYEGYGPSGTAFIVACLTDNRNRTAGDIRHYFDKFGGNLGQVGSVSFLFEQRGILLINAQDIDEEKIIEQSIESGAKDCALNEEFYEIITDVNNFFTVRDAFEDYGYIFEIAQKEYNALTNIELQTAEEVNKINRLIEALEENDDVQDIWHNWLEK